MKNFFLHTKHIKATRCRACLDYQHSHSNVRLIGWWKRRLIIVATVVLLGFGFPTGLYGWLRLFANQESELKVLRSYVYSIGFCLLVHICTRSANSMSIRSAKLANLINRYYAGFYFLGWQIDCSLTSYMQLQTTNIGE